MLQLPSDLRRPNRRREAGSMMMSVTLVSSVVAGVMLGGGQQVSAVDELEEPLLVHMIEAAAPTVARLPEGGSDAAPQAAPPAREPETEPAPVDAAPVAPASVDAARVDAARVDAAAVVPAPSAIGGDLAATTGAPEAGAGPGGGGGGTGPGTGAGPGEGPGPGAGELQAEDVTVRRRVMPRYPADREARALGETRCRVLMTVDESGRPVSVDLGACPSPFRAEAGRAAMGWRFHPHRVGGVAVPFHFRLDLVFRPGA